MSRTTVKVLSIANAIPGLKTLGNGIETTLAISLTLHQKEPLTILALFVCAVGIVTVLSTALSRVLREEDGCVAVHGDRRFLSRLYFVLRLLKSQKWPKRQAAGQLKRTCNDDGCFLANRQGGIG